MLSVMRNPHSGLQMSSFLIVGVVATGIQYVVLVSLVAVTSVDVVLSSTIGFAVSSVINYELNRGITFSSSLPRRKTAGKFVVMVLFGLWVNGMIMWFANHVLNIHYLYAQIVATGVVLIQNYVISKFWTFSK